MDGGVFKRFLRPAIAPFQRKVRHSSKKIKKIQFGLHRILLTVTFLQIVFIVNQCVPVKVSD